jgi:translocation and assembly module TamA
MLDADAGHAEAARVMVRVAEQPLNQVTVGVGVSAKTGPRVTYEHTWRRVFGQPATARNKFEWGRDRQAWEGDVATRPGPDLFRWFTGGTLERLLSPSDEVVSAYLRFGRVQDLLTDEVSYFGQYDSSSTRTNGSRDDAIALSAHYQWVWRRIDNPLLPTRGFTLSAQVGGGYARETSGDNAGDSGGFTRLYGRLTGYLPFGERWFGTARLEAGQVFAPGNLAVPDGLRFRAGGDDSVRGYAYRSLGPLVGGEVGSGNSLLTGSVEIARPFVDSMPQFLGAVFVDAGNASQSFRDYKAVFGSGIGVRWRSPVGPLKLDLAYGHEVEQFRLHFSVGIVF